MACETISVAPIAGALGAEVSGVDLARKLPNATIAEIRQALLTHLVIFFRDQHLTPEQHLALGRRFGPLQVHDFVEAMTDYPEILEVRKEPEETRNFGGGWHTDVSYLERPSLGSLLYALEAPEYGGDTLFANQYLAYETLSDGMKRMLDGLTAIHSARRPYGSNASRAQEYGPSSMRFNFSEKAHDEIEHPVVRTHSETGRKALYVNRTFTLRFKDMTEAESAPLLNYLYGHAVRPEFTCRFRWQPGSLAFWDNRGPAQRDQRLPRTAAADAPGHDRGRAPGLTAVAVQAFCTLAHISPPRFSYCPTEPSGPVSRGPNRMRKKSLH